MDPKHLMYLAEIVALGSLSRAAQRLNVTQPTLSRVVRVLEDRIGSPVLRRGRYGVTPTVIGEQLAQEGREIARRAALAKEAIDHWRQGLNGEVKIGIGPMLAATVMGGFFRGAITQKWPYSVQVISGYAARLIADLHQNDIDAAILPTRLNLQQERLNQTMLFEDQLTVVASASGRFGKRTTPVRVEELAGCPWIETAAISGLHGTVSDLFALIGLPHQTPKLRTRGDIMIALEVVAQTDALCFLPRNSLGMLSEKFGIRMLDLDVPLPSRDVSFWTNTTKRDRPEIRHLEGTLQAYFQTIGLGLTA